jgi:hypothetical protein
LEVLDFVYFPDGRLQGVYVEHDGCCHHTNCSFKIRQP